AVELAARDAPGIVLAGDQSTLEVAREAIGSVARLEIHGHALPGRVFHSPIVVNVGEEEVAALLPPERSLGRPVRAAEARGQLLDRLVRAEALVGAGAE